jgi:hypothetical protein
MKVIIRGCGDRQSSKENVPRLTKGGNESVNKDKDKDKDEDRTGVRIGL